MIIGGITDDAAGEVLDARDAELTARKRPEKPRNRLITVAIIQALVVAMALWRSARTSPISALVASVGRMASTWAIRSEMLVRTFTSVCGAWAVGLASDDRQRTAACKSACVDGRRRRPSALPWMTCCKQSLSVSGAEGLRKIGRPSRHAI